MTNRTVQFWGQGYSTPPGPGLAFTPCTITATVAGNVVFSGPIPTLESSDILRQPGEQQILFTCEIPLVTIGNLYTIPVSLQITGDDIFLEQIQANYCRIANPIYTPEQIAILNLPPTLENQPAKVAVLESVANPPLSQADIDFLSNNVWPEIEPVLAANNLNVEISSGVDGFYTITQGNPTDIDARSNVVVTNATYVSPGAPDPLPPGVVGTWGREIETAPGQTSTMTFNMNVYPGL